MKRWILLGVCLWIFFFHTQKAEASEESRLEELDFTKIQEVLEETFPDVPMNFEELVKGMIKGEIKASFSVFLEWFIDACLYDIRANQKAVVLLLGIGIMAAVFHNVSVAFSNQQIADTAFFITYLAFMTITIAAFQTAAQTAFEALKSLENFMRALVPAFYLAVTFAVGSGTAIGFYQITLIVMGIINSILLRIVIPCIKVSVVFVMINHLSKEDMLSKLSELFKTGIQWVLKTTLTVVIGLNTLQGLILPAVDTMKVSMIRKSVSMIPGIGGSAEAVAELMTNSGALIKNGVGMAAFLFIALIAFLPILKIVIFVILYQITCAMLQPISDGRMVAALSGICDGAKSLLNVVVTATVLYLITIAIVCATTSMMMK